MSTPTLLGLAAMLAVPLVSACSLTVPPPVDVRGPTPIIIEPAPPPATVVVPRAY